METCLYLACACTSEFFDGDSPRDGHHFDVTNLILDLDYLVKKIE